MGQINISHQVYLDQMRAAEPYRKTHDNHLPNTPFWNYVVSHYDNAVATGHLARFEYYHCPTIVEWCRLDALPYPVPAPPPPPPPPPILPPGPAPNPHPECPIPPPPGPCPHPNAVPEPLSLITLLVGIVLAFVFYRFWRRNWFRDVIPGHVICDLAKSDWHTITLSEHTTISLLNVGSRNHFALIIVQGGRGSNTITWFNGIQWASGSEPVLHTRPGDQDIFAFKQVSTNLYYGFPIIGTSGRFLSESA